MFYIWVLSQSSSPKCSCPARTTKRRFRHLLPLLDNISFCPYYFSLSPHLLREFWARKSFKFSLVNTPTQMTVSIVKQTPTFSCLLFLVYLVPHNSISTSPFLSQKNTAPCGAAHFLRWSSQTLDIYVPVRVSTRIVSPSLTNSGTWSV